MRHDGLALTGAVDMDRQRGHSIHPIAVALGLAFATTAFGAEAPPESREAVVLHARLAPTVTAIDTRPDSFESLIGTSGKNADSDGDGRPDGEELPFAALPVSDPLVADGPSPCIPR
jgi:hypothetical protein